MAVDEFRFAVGETSPLYTIDLDGAYWQKLRPIVYDHERLARSLLRPQFSLRALLRLFDSYINLGLAVLQNLY